MDHINAIDNKRRSSKLKIKSKDLVFMSLAVVEHGTNWYFLDHQYLIKWVRFEIIVDVTVVIPFDSIYDMYVSDYEIRFKLDNLTADKNSFRIYPTFWCANEQNLDNLLPTSVGTMQAFREWYCGKAQTICIGDGRFFYINWIRLLCRQALFRSNYQ